MSAPDDASLYEWAEFNLPTELLQRPRTVSPLARRVLAGDRRSAEAAAGAMKRRGLPGVDALLFPFGFRTLPKP